MANALVGRVTENEIAGLLEGVTVLRGSMTVSRIIERYLEREVFADEFEYIRTAHEHDALEETIKNLVEQGKGVVLTLSTWTMDVRSKFLSRSFSFVNIIAILKLCAMCEEDLNYNKRPEAPSYRTVCRYGYER